MTSAPPVGPFDDLRSYLDALEATGNLLRVDELDQSRYEATALAYRLVERYGITRAPAFVVERVRQPAGTVTELDATVRIDTPQEVQYYQHGGILHYVLRQLAAAGKAA